MRPIKQTLFTIVICLNVLSLFGQTQDTVILRDGTKLPGEIKQLKSGRLEFDIKNVGIVKIKFDKLSAFKGTTREYRVETSDRRIFFGKIEPADSARRIMVTMPIGMAVIPINNISSLTPLEQGEIFRTLKGYLSSGFNYARSTNAGRFNLDAALRAEFQKIHLDASGNMFVTQTDTAWVRDRESLAVSGFYIINPWIAAGGYVSYQRNFELGLARRFQEGLGLRVSMLNKNNFQIRGTTGVVFNQEKNIEGVQFPNQAEIPIQFGVEYFKFSKPNISINTAQTVYFGITDRGRLRSDGDIRVSWEVITDLSFSLQFYHNFDNRPPGGNNRNWDYGTVLGLKYELK